MPSIHANSPTVGALALAPSPKRVTGEFAHSGDAQRWLLHRVFAVDSPYSPSARTLAAALATYLGLDHATGRAVVYHGLQRLARETGLSYATVKRAGAELEGRTGKPVLFARSRGAAEGRTDKNGRTHFKTRALYVWTLVTQPAAFAQARDAARKRRERETQPERTLLGVAHARQELTDDELVRALAELKRSGRSSALERLDAARGAPERG